MSELYVFSIEDFILLEPQGVEAINIALHEALLVSSFPYRAATILFSFHPGIAHILPSIDLAFKSRTQLGSVHYVRHLESVPPVQAISRWLETRSQGSQGWTRVTFVTSWGGSSGTKDQIAEFLELNRRAMDSNPRVRKPIEMRCLVLSFGEGLSDIRLAWFSPTVTTSSNGLIEVAPGLFTPLAKGIASQERYSDPVKENRVGTVARLGSHNPTRIRIKAGGLPDLHRPTRVFSYPWDSDVADRLETAVVGEPFEWVYRQKRYIAILESITRGRARF